MSTKPKAAPRPPSIHMLAHLAIQGHRDMEDDALLNRVKGAIIQAVLDHETDFIAALRKALTEHQAEPAVRHGVLDSVRRAITLHGLPTCDDR